MKIAGIKNSSYYKRNATAFLFTRNVRWPLPDPFIKHSQRNFSNDSYGNENNDKKLKCSENIEKNEDKQLLEETVDNAMMENSASKQLKRFFQKKFLQLPFVCIAKESKIYEADDNVDSSFCIHMNKTNVDILGTTESTFHSTCANTSKAVNSGADCLVGTMEREDDFKMNYAFVHMTSNHGNDDLIKCGNIGGTAGTTPGDCLESQNPITAQAAGGGGGGDPCGDKGKIDPCKKREDPCKKKEEDPCKKKAEDPCKKKAEDPCKKKEDPCKKKADPCKGKEKKKAPPPPPPPPKATCRPPPKCGKVKSVANFWRNVSLFALIPFVILLSGFILSTREEIERPEFRKWEYMRRRTKRFPWGDDGQKSLFHNPRVNALPDGYEDDLAKAEEEAAHADHEEDVKSAEQAAKEAAAAEKRALKEREEAEKKALKEKAEAEKKAAKERADAEKQAAKEKAEAEKQAAKEKAEAEKLAKQQAAEAEKARLLKEKMDKEAAAKCQKAQQEAEKAKASCGKKD